MRTCIVRAAIAMALLPAVAGAQSLSLTEAEALARLSPDSPRVRVAVPRLRTIRMLIHGHTSKGCALASSAPQMTQLVRREFVLRPHEGQSLI